MGIDIYVVLQRFKALDYFVMYILKNKYIFNFRNKQRLRELIANSYMSHKTLSLDSNGANSACCINSKFTSRWKYLR